MLPLIGFFLAGFVWPVWPWGVVAAFVLQAVAMMLTAERYAVWLHRPRKYLVQLVAIQLGGAVILHSLAMGAANLLRWAL